MKRVFDVAMATVALRETIEDALQVAGIPNGSVQVTTRRPDKADEQAASVNLFLYHVEPNTSLRNLDAPTRRSDGRTLQPSRMALDLHYLVSFYGNQGTSPEKLLGATVTYLYARPLLSPTRIRDAWDEVSGASVEDEEIQQYLDEVPRVALSLTQFSLEDLSKLWSVLFQVPYVLSVAYRATAVILEQEHHEREALPVLVPRFRSQVGSPPRIDRVRPLGPLGTPLVMGSTLLIQGQYLSKPGARSIVRIDDTELEPVKETATELRVVLSPQALPDLGVGAHVLTVGVTDDHGAVDVLSAPVGLVVQPKVALLVIDEEVTEATVASGSTLALRIVPPVVPKQVRLVLRRESDESAPAGVPSIELQPSTGLPEPTSELDFQLPQLASGNYIVRAFVGRIGSPLVPAESGTPRLLPRIHVSEA